MARQLTIGRAAAAAGCKVQTVRYYEAVGLLPAAERTGGNQRLYDEATVRRLAFIRHARELGFPLAAVRELLELANDPQQPCAAADALARRHLEQVDERIRRLETLRDDLRRMVDRCGRDGTAADCRVLETVADHALCGARVHEPA